MGTLLRHIVDDIIVDLKQTFDDQKVNEVQVAYWTILVGNRLLSQHVEKRDSGAFLATYILPVAQFQSNTNPDQVKNRKYIKLPHAIFDYTMDGGIEFIAYYRDDSKPGCSPEFTRCSFTRTKQSEAEVLYYTKNEKPSPKNPYFYRVGDYLYFLGLECVNLEQVEIGIYQTIDPVTDINLDAPFDFPEELLIILKRQVLDLGRFSLLLPEERINDGKNDLGGKQVPTNKITSVQDLGPQDQQ